MNWTDCNPAPLGIGNHPQEYRSAETVLIHLAESGQVGFRIARSGDPRAFRSRRNVLWKVAGRDRAPFIRTARSASSTNVSKSVRGVSINSGAGPSRVKDRRVRLYRLGYFTVVPSNTNGERRLRLTQCLYCRWLHAQWPCMLLPANGARVPIPMHLAA